MCVCCRGNVFLCVYVQTSNTPAPATVAPTYNDMPRYLSEMARGGVPGTRSGHRGALQEMYIQNCCVSVLSVCNLKPTADAATKSTKPRIACSHWLVLVCPNWFWRARRAVIFWPAQWDCTQWRLPLCYNILLRRKEVLVARVKPVNFCCRGGWARGQFFCVLERTCWIDLLTAFLSVQKLFCECEAWKYEQRWELCCNVWRDVLCSVKRGHECVCL